MTKRKNDEPCVTLMGDKVINSADSRDALQPCCVPKSRVERIVEEHISTIAAEWLNDHGTLDKVAKQMDRRIEVAIRKIEHRIDSFVATETHRRVEIAVRKILDDATIAVDVKAKVTP